jgi:hypothetical protein
LEEDLVGEDDVEGGVGEREAVKGCRLFGKLGCWAWECTTDLWMALGIGAWVGAPGSHYLPPSEGIRHCSETILLREVKIQPLGKSEQYFEKTWDAVPPQN